MRGVDRIEFWIFLAENGNPASWFRRLDAGNDLDQRRLAGAVFTDKAMHLADLQRQIDLAKRMHAAKALRYAGHLQESRQGSSCNGTVCQTIVSTRIAFPTGEAGNAARKVGWCRCGPRALQQSAHRWFPC